MFPVGTDIYVCVFKIIYQLSIRFFQKTARAMVVPSHVAYACCLYALGVCNSDATTIVLHWSPERELIASDSLAVEITGSGEIGNAYAACKIRQGGHKCYFAIAGVMHSTEFDLAGMAQTACLNGNDLQSTGDIFQPTAFEKFRAFREEVRVANPILYKAVLRRGFSGVAFVGFQNGELRDTLITFEDSPTGEPRTRRSRIISDALVNKKSAWLWYGVVDEIEKYTRRTPDWDKGDPVVVVRHLIQLEINAQNVTPSNKRTVGPPITMLEITQRGSQWISRGACPKITESRRPYKSKK